MARTRRYRLHPHGAFHFGERGVGVEETAELLHSDTLFAALVSAWRMLGLQAGPDDLRLPLLDPFLERQPPFLISSALPFAGPLQLFPRPLLSLGREKALKEVRYVTPGALRLIIQGAGLTPERAERELIQGGQVWALPGEQAQIRQLLLADEPNEKERERLTALWEREPARLELWWAGDDLVPRVTLDRRNAAANLFHVGQLRFAHGCGLAFWANYTDEAYIEHLEAALTVLQEEGLGGKRSVGHGQFNCAVDDTPPEALLDLADDDTAPTCQLTLSLYAPRPEEYELLGAAWYRRILRRGWIFSPEGRNLRRRGIWMLREGSLLPAALPAAPLGLLADVQPEIGFEHPVWRYGYAFCLPLRLVSLGAPEEEG
ncbi:MAG: type III-A CRISPR-associated RAMP protein Csm4 [Oscillochloridaceae bacterium umkhey_bin13]